MPFIDAAPYTTTWLTLADSFFRLQSATFPAESDSVTPELVDGVVKYIFPSGSQNTALSSMLASSVRSLMIPSDRVVKSIDIVVVSMLESWYTLMQYESTMSSTMYDAVFDEYSFTTSR